MAQNYADDDATSIATKAPSVQIYSQRVTLSLAAYIPNIVSYTRNITQSYIQSHSELERDVHIQAPPELDLPPGCVLEVVKTLYGIPESGLHCYLTYLAHHLDTLKMRRPLSYPLVLILYHKEDATESPDGIILQQVDDSLGFGTQAFLEEEERASRAFRCKPRTPLSSEKTSSTVYK